MADDRRRGGQWEAIILPIKLSAESQPLDLERTIVCTSIVARLEYLSTIFLQYCFV